MSPAPFYARPVSALGDQSNLSTMLSRAGGRPVSRRFSRRDFFISKFMPVGKFFVDYKFPWEYSDFASGGERHRAAPQRQSKVSDPGKQND